MKKLLVLLVSAAMVFAFAAASMAAVNVSADWRGEWEYDEAATPDKTADLGYSLQDLRFNFDGKVSDTIDAHLQESFNGASTLATKEWWALFKEGWGTFQAGFWDYKLIPSRVIEKPHGVNCIDEKTMQFVATVPFADAFSFGVLVIPSFKDNMMDYDLKLAYKADSWGAEVHVGEDVAATAGTYQAFDVYYQITKDLKVFVNGINYDIDANTTLLTADGSKKFWNDDLAAVLGAQWKNIAGSKLTASLEVGLEQAGPVGDEFTPWSSQLKYAFNNKLALEVEYYNHQDNKELSKLIIRPRIAF